MRTTLSRLQRRSIERRAARDCPPHPPSRLVLHLGDYATPDRLVCGRCGALVSSRRHEPPRERQG